MAFTSVITAVEGISSDGTTIDVSLPVTHGDATNASPGSPVAGELVTLTAKSYTTENDSAQCGFVRGTYTTAWTDTTAWPDYVLRDGWNVDPSPGGDRLVDAMHAAWWQIEHDYRRASDHTNFVEAHFNYISKTISKSSLTLTFNAAARTIVRSAGSWITDGFVPGMYITCAGAANPANNAQVLVLTVEALTITCAVGTVLTNEGPTASCSASAYIQLRPFGIDVEMATQVAEVAVAGQFYVAPQAGGTNVLSVVPGTASTFTETVKVGPAGGGTAYMLVNTAARVGTEVMNLAGTTIVSGGITAGAADMPDYAVDCRGSLGVSDGTNSGFKLINFSGADWRLEPVGTQFSKLHIGGSSMTYVDLQVDYANGIVAIGAFSWWVQRGSAKRIEVDATGTTFETGQFRRTSYITPSALASGRTDNYAPTGYGTCAGMYLTCNAAGSQLSGLAGGVDGAEATLYPDATGVLTLNHEDANSTAANRFICPGGAAKVCAAPDVVRIRYRAGSVNRWLVG